MLITHSVAVTIQKPQAVEHVFCFIVISDGLSKPYLTACFIYSKEFREIVSDHHSERSSRNIPVLATTMFNNV